MISFNHRITFVLLQRENLYYTLSRKKPNEEETVVKKNQLKRVLDVYDLTALGTGSTLGCGVYVLAGTVAREYAGPAVVLSFILAAVVSAFSGRYESSDGYVYNKYDFVALRRGKNTTTIR